MQHLSSQFPQIKFAIAFLIVVSVAFTGCSTAQRQSAADSNRAALSTAQTIPGATASNTSTVANSASMLNSNSEIFADEGRRSDHERYAQISENPFLETARAPLSTFSIDVDTASYANVRRFLKNGQMPPADAVRIEELINYFEYDYPQPIGDVPFSVVTETAACPWNPKHQIALIGLQGKQISLDNAPPSNLVFLIDVSGSMNDLAKLPLVKQGLKLLANQLSAKDRAAIVVYAGTSGLVLPSTTGDRKKEILNAIDNLEAGGSTNGGEGIQLAYRIAQENFIQGGNNRVILATDGDFNVGVTSDDELVRLIENKRQSNVFLSVLGFGAGNYNDSMMEKLSNKGNGNYAYVDSLEEARKALGEQIAGTLYTIAKDVKIQVEFNPVNIAGYRLIGYENRVLADKDFNDDKKDAGEIGAGIAVTALYEIVPAGQKVENPGVDALKYANKIEPAANATSNELLTVKLRYKKPSENESRLLSIGLGNIKKEFEAASENLRFAASVAEFGLLLRNSRYKGNASWNNVLQRAQNARGQDLKNYRGEFAELVTQARNLIQ